MDKIDKNEFQWLNSSGLLIGLAIFAINLIAKALFLGEPAIGMDEPFTLFRVQKSFSELINDLAQNNHPPLFESIMWLWLRLVGYNPVLLRIIPLLFSSLAALAIFFFGKKHFSLFVGLVAALLFTFSDYHFYLSHEIRSYPLFALLTVLSFHFYLTSTNLKDSSFNKNKIGGIIGLALINTLLLYTHYFSATIVAAQLFHAFILVRKRALNLQMLTSSAIMIILYLPQIIMVKTRMLNKVEGGHWLASPPLDELFNVLRKFFNAPILVVVALSIIVLTAIIKREKALNNKISALVLLFPGIYIGMWVLSQWVPVFQDRYISFTTLGALILLAIALDTVPKKIGITLAILLIGAMSFTLKYKPNNKQWAIELAQLVRTENTEKTKVFIYPNWSLQCFSYHFDLEHFKDYKNTESLLKKENIDFGFTQNVDDFISNNKDAEKFIIINFEGPISELAKDFGHLQHRVIEKDRHGVLIIDR